MSATGEVRYRKMGLGRTALLSLIIPAALGSCVGMLVHHDTEPRYRTDMTVRLSSGSPMRAESAAAEYLGGMMDSATLQATNLAVLQDDNLKAVMVDEQILARPPLPPHFRGMSRDEIVEEVTGAITVSRKGEWTSLVLITAEGTDPDSLPDLVMRFWTQFSSMRSTIQSNIMDRGLAQVKKEMNQASRLREEAEHKLQDHLRKSSFSQTSFLTCRERLPEKESELRRQRDALDMRLLLDADLYDMVRIAMNGEGLSGLLGLFDDERVATNEDVRTLRKEIDDAREEFEQQKAKLNLSPGDPRWKAMDERIGKLQSKLDRTRRDVLSDFLRSYQSAQRRQKALAAEQALLTREIAKFEETARIFDILKTEVDVTKERFDRLAMAHDEILRDMGRAMADDSTGIVFEPCTPREPYNLDLGATVGTGAMAGLVFGPILCLILGFLRLLQLLAPRVKVRRPEAADLRVSGSPVIC